MKASMTSEMMTIPQAKQLQRLFEDGAAWAIELVGKELTKEEAQRALGMGDDLRAGFPELIRALAKGRYADQEVASNYDYPPEYQGFAPIDKQVKELLKCFPKLDASWVLEEGSRWYKSLSLPDWVEGPLVYVRHEALGGYNTTLEKLLAEIAKTRAFYNWRAGKIGHKYLQQVDRTAEAEEKLHAIQPGDFLLVPNQAGKRHRGRSTLRVGEMMVAGEFGLGAVAEACRVLIHPERYVRWQQLHTDLPGDKYSDGGDGLFDQAPCFYFVGGKVRFGTEHVSDACDNVGAASALVPQ